MYFSFFQAFIQLVIYYSKNLPPCSIRGVVHIVLVWLQRVYFYQ